VTILGHVQRGGAPSAFDRNLGTRCGHRAVHELLALGPDEDAKLVGIRENRITTSNLVDAVERTHSVADLLAEQRYDEAMELRGGSFVESHEILRTLVRAQPSAPEPGQRTRRIAVLHAGGPAPGMNTAVRAAVRLILDGGHEALPGLPRLRGAARRRGRARDLDVGQRVGLERWRRARHEPLATATGRPPGAGRTARGPTGSTAC
jgi:6-phosphofructokinase 1